jgi:ribonuclease BN (tRNA processing enzyme)
MNLRILGCSGAEFPDRRPPAFLLDKTLLLDAGTVGAVLTAPEQEQIRQVLLTHTHLDHVRGLAFLADNRLVGGSETTIEVIGTAVTLHSLREHLLNGLIWPDFSRLPSPEHPIIRYCPIEPGEPLRKNGYTIVAFPVNHSVPTVAYRVERDGTALVYTGDTGPTNLIWREAGDLAALIVEVSFPNMLEDLALMTGHLTAELLAIELAKLPIRPQRTLVSHLKPQYEDLIRAEVAALAIPGLEILRDGMEYSFSGREG